MSTDGYALVTGAGSGLGKSLALRLADEGFPVALVGRTEEKLLSVQRLLGVKRSLVLRADVSSQPDVHSAFDRANTWASRPSVVVACAGQAVFGEVGSFSQDDILQALSGSLVGTILVAQRAFVEMKETGGTIVNVMSTAAFLARIKESVYCAAKWGARGFTESLRMEAKPTGVRIMGVYPGGMKTPFWSADVGMSVDCSGFMAPEDVADVIVDNLLGKTRLYVSDLVISRL